MTLFDDLNTTHDFDRARTMATAHQSGLKESVEALGQAIVTLAEMIAEVLRKVVDAVERIVERIVERAARGFLAARLSRWIGRRPAHWLAQRWPRQLLPTRAFWRGCCRSWRRSGWACRCF